MLFIKNMAGVPIYKLECHNGNYEELSGLDFSGDFQYALFAIKGGTINTWNLLVSQAESEQRSEWLDRGRVTSNQFRGECGEVPEYGKLRNFRLRGMLITLEFSNLKWSPESKSSSRMEQFTFEVSVMPDKNATTATADIVKRFTPYLLSAID